MAALEKHFTIINEIGLHARVVTQLVQTAARFDAKIELERAGKRVSGKSIIDVLTLSVSRGAVVKVHCQGHDAQEALLAIEQLLVQQRLGEVSGEVASGGV